MIFLVIIFIFVVNNIYAATLGEVPFIRLTNDTCDKNITYITTNIYTLLGGGAWVDGGDYLYPNSTFADNIEVRGYIKAFNWTNVTITESQITDFGTYLTSTQINNSYALISSIANFVTSTQLNESYALNVTLQQYIDWISGNNTYVKLDAINNSYAQIDQDESFAGNVEAVEFKGKFNWTSGDDWNIFDSSTLTFNESKLETQFFNVNTIEVITGTPQGAITDIQSYNNIPYNVSEVSSDLELRLNFTGINSFNEIIVRYKSPEEVGGTHVMAIQMYNLVDESWEDYGELPNSEIYHILEFGVFDADDHIDSTGTVQLRFYQDEGIPAKTHKHEFDWVTISKGFGTPTGEEVDPHAIYKDGSTQLTDNWPAGDFNITTQSFIGDGTYLTGLTNHTLEVWNTWGEWFYNQTSSAIDWVLSQSYIPNTNVAFTNETQTFAEIQHFAKNVSFADNITVGDNVFYVDSSSGRVGIGTTSPSSKLHVYNGDVNFSNATDQQFFFDSGSGRVGIGTSSPDSVFHIKANFPGWVGNNYAGQIIIQNPADTVFSNVVISAYESDGDGNPDQQLWYLGSSSTGNSDINFLNRRNSKLQLGTDGTYRMTILGNGNVGIGTSSPTHTLNVLGTLNVTGNTLFEENITMDRNYFCLDSGCTQFMCANSTTIAIVNNVTGVSC